MRIPTGAVLLVTGLASLLVLQGGTQAQSSCSLPSDCNDGNSCTDDACDSGVCIHADNGSCTANPKTLGYWRRVCRGVGNTGEFLTDADVNCVGPWACGYYIEAIRSVEDICQALNLSNKNGQDPDCNRGYEELIALRLNICRERLTESQGIDTNCSGPSTVGQAFLTAASYLCADSYPYNCSMALCVVKAINQGHALHVNGLVVSRLSSGGLHLVWTPPLADTEAPAATPSSYRVWRASGASEAFVQIGEVADPSFDDTSAEGAYLRYYVTPVW